MNTVTAWGAEVHTTLTQVTGWTAGHGGCDRLGAVGRGAVLGATLHRPLLTRTGGAGVWPELGPTRIHFTLVETF